MFIVNPSFDVVTSNYQLEARWEGSMPITDVRPLKPLNIKKFIIHPRGLISFFPHQTATGEKKVKLFFALRYRYFDSSRQVVYQTTELKRFWNQHNLRWGFVVNNNFREGCAVLDENSEQYTELTSNSYLNYNFDINQEQEIPPDELEFERRFAYLRYYRNSPVVFDRSCFQENEQNTIRIWWHPNFNSNNDFTTEANALELKITLPSSISLTKKITNQNFQLSTPFLFNFYINQPQGRAVFENFATETLTFNNLLLSSYDNHSSFKRLWRIKVKFFDAPYLKLTWLFKSFPIELLEADLNLISNWSPLSFSNSETQWTGPSDSSLILRNKIALKRQNFSADANVRQIGFNRFIYFYNYQPEYELSILDKTKWDTLTNSLVIDPLIEDSHLGSYADFYFLFSLFSRFNISAINHYDINLQQEITFRNLFFRDRLILIEAQNNDYQYIVYSVVWLVSLEHLREIFLELNRAAPIEKKAVTIWAENEN